MKHSRSKLPTTVRAALRWPGVASASLIVAASLVVGCSREERDFTAGGPHHPNAASGQSSSADAASGHGPQVNVDGNAYALSEGKRLYSNFNCVGCHANGGGDIGPALMDSRWFYGAKPQDVFNSIMDGRPNGMPPFRGRITDSQAWQLAAYVRSLSGQVKPDAATSRDDHMRTNAAENSVDRETPQRTGSPDPTARK